MVLNCDDGLGDTIRPRLDRSEADLKRVSAIAGLSDGSRITLADVDMLESALVKLRPALVVIDPIQGFLGRINTHRANQVRPILAGLGSLAEKYGTAVLCSRHLRKSGAGRALYRGMGSVDFAATARSVLLAGQDPSDHGRRALVHLKSSLAPNGASIGYTLNGGGFKWAEVSNLTADDLLRPDTSPEERSAREEAKAKDACRVAVAPYREACRKAGVECEFAGARAMNVSERVRSLVEKADGGVRVTVEGRPQTKEVIPTKALKDSVAKAAYAYTDKHIGPKERVGNKGGSLSNRLRAVLPKS